MIGLFVFCLCFGSVLLQRHAAPQPKPWWITQVNPNSHDVPAQDFFMFQQQQAAPREERHGREQRPRTYTDLPTATFERQHQPARPQPLPPPAAHLPPVAPPAGPAPTQQKTIGFPREEPRLAIAILTGDVRGHVTFYQRDPRTYTQVNGRIEGLTPGPHGFHIHAFGDVSGGCASTGGHFNPHDRTHGAPQDSNRHVGDLGNIFADRHGVAVVDIQDGMISLYGETANIVGRAVTIHEGEDDLGHGQGEDREGSLRAGNAGGRAGCALIGIANPDSFEQPAK